MCAVIFSSFAELGQCNKREDNRFVHLYDIARIPSFKSDESAISNHQDSNSLWKRTSDFWARRVDANVTLYLLIIASGSALDRYRYFWHDGEISGNGVVAQVGQLVLCHLQLMIIVGLCLDKGRSATSKILGSRYGHYQVLK